MSSKFEVLFNVDVSHIAPEMLRGQAEPTADAVKEVITTMLIENARARSKAEFHKIRRDTVMDSEVKTIRMAEQLRSMMLSLMAQANLSVRQIADDVDIQTELPFERQYAA